MLNGYLKLKVALIKIVFWLILTHRSVMSSFGGKKKWPTFSKAPARASGHQLVLLDFLDVVVSVWKTKSQGRVTG